MFKLERVISNIFGVSVEVSVRVFRQALVCFRQCMWWCKGLLMCWSH